MNRVFTFEVIPKPDFWIGPVPVTRTIWMTWIVMAVLIVLALVARRQLLRPGIGWLQNVFEAFMEYLDAQIREIVQRPPERYFPLIATLFVFVLFSNLVATVPRMVSPTADIATTSALALVVFLAVPAYGIADRGFGDYLGQYLKPMWIMLPFNIVGEFSRTLAMSVRLFGNVMSGAVIVGVLVFVGGILAVPIGLLGLLTGVIQAYIFAVLTMVYIGGAVRASARERREETEEGA